MGVKYLANRIGIRTKTSCENSHVLERYAFVDLLQDLFGGPPDFILGTRATECFQRRLGRLLRR